MAPEIGIPDIGIRILASGYWHPDIGIKERPTNAPLTL
jgi:hypothetical protein